MLKRSVITTALFLGLTLIGAHNVLAEGFVVNQEVRLVYTGPELSSGAQIKQWLNGQSAPVAELKGCTVAAGATGVVTEVNDDLSATAGVARNSICRHFSSQVTVTFLNKEQCHGVFIVSDEPRCQQSAETLSPAGFSITPSATGFSLK